MQILITGASGFIGSCLAKKLAKNPDFEITVTGRHPTLKETFASLPVRVIQGDLLNLKTAEQATKDIDIVIHCAGLAGTWGDYTTYFRANVLVTENLITTSKFNKVKRFINISSPSMYLDFCHQLDIDEDFLPSSFSNHYARTKYEAEQLVTRAHSSIFQTISLRPRMVIGAGDNNLLPRLIRLQQSGLLKQVGDGNNLVDFTSITNLLNLIESCFVAPDTAMGRAYNVSNGKPEKLWDIIDKVCSLMDITTQRQKLPYRPILLLAKINEKINRILKSKKEPSLLPLSVSILANSMTLNIDAAKSLLGYHPIQTTDESISEFVSWWKQTA